MKVRIHTYPSPCGDLLLGAFDGKLCLCDWASEKEWKVIERRIFQPLHTDYEEQADETILLAVRQLDEYFSGKRQTFSVPLLAIGTEFQKRVWQVLQNIPYGATWSYKQEAELLGNLRAIRAVAQANGANPISIFVPCHRVIGSNGTLTGYGGGLKAKQYLLQLEAGFQSVREDLFASRHPAK